MRRGPRPRLLSVAAVTLAGVLAARGSVVADAPAGRYQIGADGTVTDTKTHLVWQQTAPNGNMSWDAARSYCSSLALGGTGWRMPSLGELMTLIDDTTTATAKIDPTAFPGTVTNPPYWSATELAGAPTRVWVVLFGSGINNDVAKTVLYRVRCVR